MTTDNAIQKVFSVVVPHHGRHDCWKSCLKSILAQDYPCIELIFCDDGTPDFDIAAVERFITENAHDHLVRWKVYSNPENFGTVRNFRTAHQHCTGHYLTQIASDDAYHNPGVLSSYARRLDATTPDVIGVYGRSLSCNDELEPTGAVSFDTEKAAAMNHMPAVDQWFELTRGCCIHMGATAFLRKAFLRTGGFDEKYRYIEDWPFFLQSTQKGLRYLYGDFDAILYRCGGVTSSTLSDVKKQCYIEHCTIYQEDILPHLLPRHPLIWLKSWLRYQDDRMAVNVNHPGVLQTASPLQRLTDKFFILLHYLREAPGILRKRVSRLLRKA